MNETTLRQIIAVAFTASGFSALAYQIAWQRVLTQVIGSDAISIVLIVTIFMACLGFGSELARRVLSIPGLKLAPFYAVVEVAIGIYGLISIPLMRSVNESWAAVGIHSVAADSALNFILLAPPVVGMGMTTPLIVELGKRHIDDLGLVTGTLYGLNIFGAALGALVTGLVLIEALGLQGTTAVAATINLTIAAALFIALRSSPSAGPVARPVQQPRMGWANSLAAVAFGFGTLAMQAILFRVLVNYFTMATIVFPLLLFTYLLLMAAGQAVGGRLADRFAGSLPILTVVLFSIGALLLVLALRFPPAWAAQLGAMYFTSFSGSLVVGDYPGLVADPSPAVIIAFGGFLMVSVVAWSALFPTMLRIVTLHVNTAGRSFARLYTLFTIGNVIGTYAVAIWLLPAIGTSASVAVTIAIVCGGSCAVARPLSKATALITVAGLACGALVPLDYFTTFRIGGYHVELAYEGQNGVATVVPTGTFYKIIDMNRTASASAIVRNPSSTDQYEAWRWNLTELFALDPDYRPKSVLIIGIGHAYLIDALLDLKFVESITIVDISDEVVRAVEENTTTSTTRIFNDPRVQIVIADGRRYVQQALSEDRRFDLIQTKINEPWHAGSGNLFTVEFIASQRRLLSPGGYLGVRPLAGHVRDALQVFDAAVYPGYYHVYFKNGPLPQLTRANVKADIREAWYKAVPGESAATSRDSILNVTVFYDDSPVAAIDLNTDDRPTFEYSWLRQTTGRWRSPRIPLSDPLFDSFRQHIPVVVE